MGKTITLLASGTRGDVQPYIALGTGLTASGYRVRIATHDAFAGSVKAWGLDFISLGENPSDLFMAAGNQDALRAGQNPFHTLRASYAYWQSARPVYAKLVQNAWRAAQDSDALIFGMPTFWGAALASALHIPGVRGLLQPLTPTRAFPCPLLPYPSLFGATGNRLSYAFCATLLNWAWRDALSKWRRAFQIPGTRAWNDDAATLYSFSTQLVPRPADYPSQHQITGYWFLPERVHELPFGLESFLNTGAEPVYIGFGSIEPYAARKMTALLLDLHRATGLRFVIPQRFMNENLPRDFFCAIGEAPHSKLFPRVCAIIHHGGTGTTATALRAGVPQIIVPMYADTFFWGARVQARHLGPRPVPEAEVTADALAYALDTLFQDTEMQTRARAVSKTVAREQGVTRAAELLRVLI